VCRFLFIAAVLLPSPALPAGETGGPADEVEFILHKTYAGEIDKRRHVAEKQAMSNARNGVEVGTSSDIECRVNTLFGVAYLVLPATIPYAALTYTWRHPHYTDLHGRTEVTCEKMLRNRHGQVHGMQFQSLRLERAMLTNGDFQLEIRNGKRLLLQHTFRIRGCAD